MRQCTIGPLLSPGSSSQFSHWTADGTQRTDLPRPAAACTISFQKWEVNLGPPVRDIISGEALPVGSLSAGRANSNQFSSAREQGDNVGYLRAFSGKGGV